MPRRVGGAQGRCVSVRLRRGPGASPARSADRMGRALRCPSRGPLRANAPRPSGACVRARTPARGAPERPTRPVRLPPATRSVPAGAARSRTGSAPPTPPAASRGALLIMGVQPGGTRRVPLGCNPTRRSVRRWWVLGVSCQGDLEHAASDAGGAGAFERSVGASGPDGVGAPVPLSRAFEHARHAPEGRGALTRRGPREGYRGARPIRPARLAANPLERPRTARVRPVIIPPSPRPWRSPARRRCTRRRRRCSCPSGAARSPA